MERTNCWLCCETIDFYAVGACGHNDMCLKCSCRLRVLHGDTKCPICKEEQAQILVTSHPEQRLDAFPALSSNNPYGFVCDGDAAHAAFRRITSFNCWLCKNKRQKRCRTQHELRKHIEGFHKKTFCNVCLKSRTVFVWEQLLLNWNEIDNHNKYGYQREIPHHPVCLFCKNRRFYDESELRSHLEATHYFCNLCDFEVAKNLYYKNYESLQRHFQTHHFVCHHELCKSNRFVVFKTEVDLQVHLQNVHSSVVRNKITVQLGSGGAREEQKNNEAVDFTSQFYPQQQAPVEEESKRRPRQKPQKGRPRRLQIVHYKELPSRPPKAVIAELKEALENNIDLFNALKDATIKFNSGKISADQLLETFISLFGARTETLFPSMITTLNDPDKQEELHQKYITYIEAKSNITAEGRCNNVFSECHTDYSVVKTMRDVFFEELTSRKAEDSTIVLFVDEEHLRQLAAMIDKLDAAQLRKLSLAMNFRVTSATRQLMLEMVSRANDVEFARGLTQKYEKHFLEQVDTQQVYVLFKYTSMALAKLKGLPFKDVPQYITNWKDEEPTEEEETQSGWSEAILGKKQRVPNYSVQEFPSLSSSVQASAAQEKWSKFQPESAKPTPKPVAKNNFPALAPSVPERTWVRSNLPEPEEKKEPAKKQVFSTSDFPALG